MGHERPVDVSILEEDSDRIAHKIRGEIFHVSYYGRLYFGASSVVAGKNTMSEIEVHLGVMTSF